MRAPIYEPEEDSYLLQKYVKKYAKGKVLDIGTGSGILALTALKNTKDVLAVDINENAVEHVKGLGINAKVSDLFENVEGKFGVIIFNPPYLPENEKDGEMKAALSGGKRGNELTERFLKEAKKHLEKGGKVLLVASSLAGDIIPVFDKLKYKILAMETKSFFFEKITAYVLAMSS